MKMNKKAQSQIITTVLIILLVLAAIVIVWQVVNNTVQRGSQDVQRSSNCLGLQLEITDLKYLADSPKDVKFRVTRRSGADDAEVTGLVFLIGGQKVTPDGGDGISSGKLGVLETTGEITIKEGTVGTYSNPDSFASKKLEVAPVLGTGQTCDAVTNAIIPATATPPN